MMKRLSLWLLLLLFGLMACSSPSDDAVIELPATDTLQPIPSLTQRVTATIRPTSTDIPTFTPTSTVTEIPPTPSDTPTPTLTPTVVGIVSAVQSINVRSGPDTSSQVITALPAGTGVQIIGQNEDGSWYNIRLLEDGREGWMASRFIRVENTPTPFPTITPSPDLTALFLGTPLPPTELIPGRATATPPTQVQSQGADDDDDDDERATIPPIATEGALPGVPTIDNRAIFQTATALAGGLPSPTSDPDDAESSPNRQITVAPTTIGTGGGASTTATQATSSTATPSGRVVRVFAFCDDPQFGDLTNVPVVRAGDRIQIWWGWIAGSEDQVADHIDASNLELSVNGEAIADANDFVGEIQPLGGSSYIAYWEVPFGPVTSGEYIIAYQVTWDRAIYDGTSFYGPETANPFEQESCTFTVN
ncbi:MAG: SH3 domain-containing protein [Anaerolineae bacterium]